MREETDTEEASTEETSTEEPSAEEEYEEEERRREPYHDLVDDAKLQWVTDIDSNLVDPIAFELSLTALRKGEIIKADFTDHYIKCVLRLRTAVQGKRTKTLADAMKTHRDDEEFPFMMPFPDKEDGGGGSRSKKERVTRKGGGLFGR